MKPIRVQRRRAKGWRLPENTVCVDRSTKWGNPFIVSKHGTRARCVELHRFLFGGYFCATTNNTDEQKKCLKYAAKNIEKLRGKNLACWCPLDKPCHADLLLEAANQ